jgi:hypothetical protein
LTAQLKQLITRKWQSKPSGAYTYDEWELKLLEPPNFGHYARIVSELGLFVRKAGKPFLVVTTPNLPSKEQFEPRYRPVERVFAQAGLPMHDLLDDFIRDYPPSSQSVLQWGANPANGHPGPTSTRFYARKVSDILEREYRDLLGPRTAKPASVAPEINDWAPPNAKVRKLAANEWEFVYPRNGEVMPYLPLSKPHVVFAFAQPVSIRRVEIKGALLREGELFITSVDPKTGIEEKEHHALGHRAGTMASWSLAALPQAARTNTLKLVAEMDMSQPERGEAARSLRLRIDFDDDPVRP